MLKKLLLPVILLILFGGFWASQDFQEIAAGVAIFLFGMLMMEDGFKQFSGGTLERILETATGTVPKALGFGFITTTIVQSSSLVSVITISFLSAGLISLLSGVVIVLGADIGTSLMAVVFSRDLSWLSPLFIFVGVVLFIARQSTTVGRIGRILIGLGLMLLALSLVSQSATVLTQAPAVKALLASLTSDLLLEIFTGAVLTVLCYSSLAMVLLTATLATTNVIPLDVALGLVLGANLGSGLLGVLTTMGTSIETRQVPLGNLIFKIIGIAIAAPFVGFWIEFLGEWLAHSATVVVLYHLCFNLAVGAVFIGVTPLVARWSQMLLPKPAVSTVAGRQRHLDATALATPSLAISCAVREAMHQADIVETMLTGMLRVIKNNDSQLALELRKMDDTVDELYSDIKYYLTKISREALSDSEGQRWTDIISFTINMEQIGDIVERVLIDIEDKKIRTGRNFSDAGMQEISDMHGHLVDNLRLGMSVFLHGNVRDAQRLLEEKTRFRNLERRYASTHLDRLADKTVQSIETSSLHLDLISDLKRINSHICSIAYPILDSAGALAPNRLKKSVLDVQD